MKFQFSFRGFRWPHVDVRVAKFSAGFLELRGLHCWLINELCGLSFNKVGWLRFGLLQETRCIVSAGSPSSGLRIEHRFFFGFLILQGICW